MSKNDLRSEIEKAINRNSAENRSNTPDFVLAGYLMDCLAAFDRAVTAREKWYGRDPELVTQNPRPQSPASLLDGRVGPCTGCRYFGGKRTQARAEKCATCSPEHSQYEAKPQAATQAKEREP